MRKYREAWAWAATDKIVRDIVPSIIDHATGFSEIASRLRDIPVIAEHSGSTEELVRGLASRAVKLKNEAQAETEWKVAESRNVRNKARNRVYRAMGDLHTIAGNEHKRMPKHEACMLTELVRLIALCGLMTIEAEKVKQCQACLDLGVMLDHHENCKELTTDIIEGKPCLCPLIVCNKCNKAKTRTRGVTMGMKPRLKTNGKCHYCGEPLASGFLWCTSRCLDSYNIRRDKKDSSECYAFWDPKVRVWVSVSPQLDLVSQGDTEVGAMTALADSITLWVIASHQEGSISKAMDHRLECVKKRKEKAE